LKNSGFTLVEMGIVLVVIGLIITTVLTAQSLIDRVKINSAIDQITKYNLAINTFNTKYKSLPGDIERASSFGIDRPLGLGTIARNVAQANGGGQNGNGDFILQDSSGTQAAFDGEIANFWTHLSNVNLVHSRSSQIFNCTGGACSQNADYGYPLFPVGEGIIAMSVEKLLYYAIGIGPSLSAGLDDVNEGTANSIAHESLTPEEASGIDLKLDDGMPGSGAIQIFSDYENGDWVLESTLSSTDCATALGSDYNLIITTRVCALFIKVPIS
jgi:prepilin-type N-terminal cleavage/methylation domain-containing protein